MTTELLFRVRHKEADTAVLMRERESGCRCDAQAKETFRPAQAVICSPKQSNIAPRPAKTKACNSIASPPK